MLSLPCCQVSSEDYHATVLSPSPRVDEIWHMCLLMPMYYLRLCVGLLNDAATLLDHKPVGIDAVARAERVEATRAVYKDVFVAYHNAWFWEDEEERLKEEKGRESKRVGVLATPVALARVAAPSGSPSDAVTLRLKDQSGAETLFKVKTTARLSSLCQAYASRIGVSVGSFRFTIYGSGLMADTIES